MHITLGHVIGLLVLIWIVVTAVTAIYVAWQARRAERRHPPLGRFIEVNGVRLHYVERGQGQPVVLLHGNGTMVEDWAISGVLDQVAQRHRVIAFDRPGFGHSSRPRDRAWTPDLQAELLDKALHQLKVERPVVVGHSWGTMVAVALALNRPETVKGLVLLSGYYFPTPRLDFAMASLPSIPIVGDLMRYTVSPIMGGLFGNVIAKKIFAPAPVPRRFLSEFPMGLALRPSQIRASAEDAGLANPGARELSSRYDNLKMPIVIIAGTGDEIVDAQTQSARLHSVLSGSTMDLIQGLGHMIHYSAQQQIINAIAIAADTPSSNAA